ncbi:hypothetical protein C4J81_04285 [Deltaproteobacteria bacterium Smac51]|nr:hypothetical protein C4J81_04285 [Deltaproteobacteria bacterium Smac51]
MAFSKRVEDKVPHEIHQNFQHRFAQRRKDLRLSQRDMASKVGVSVNTIQAYESGNLPRGSNLIIVAQVLECSVDWLLGIGSDGRYQATDSDSPDLTTGMYFGLGEFIRVDRLKLHEDEPEVKDRLLFNRKWLEDISSNPKNVRLVFPNPSGLSDPVMLLDQGVTGIYQGCQYLAEINGHFSFNRVAIRPGNVLHLTATDGQSNLDFEVASSEVKIIGRLILTVNKM